MDLSNYQTNNPNELIAKLGKSQQRLLFTLVLSVVYAGGAYSLINLPNHLPASSKENNLPIQLIVIVLLVYLALLPQILAFWSMVFDRKVKLLINEKGIGYSTNLLTQSQNNYYKWFLGINKSTINSDGIGYEQAFFEWNNLSSFQLVLSKKQFGIDFYQLILKPKHAIESITINIQTLDKSHDLIQARLDAFSRKEEPIVTAPVTPDLEIKENLIADDLKTLVDTVVKLSPKFMDNADDFVVRQKKLSKGKFIVIYILAFVVGMPVSYTMFFYGYQNPSSTSYVLSFLLYAGFMFYLTKKYTKVKLTISSKGIADETTLHYWEDISAYQFKRATMSISLDKKRAKEIVLESLVLMDKEGKTHFIDVTETATDKTIDEIKAAITVATKGMDIEYHGFEQVW